MKISYKGGPIYTRNGANFLILESHGETINKDDVPCEYVHKLGFDEPEVVGCNY